MSETWIAVFERNELCEAKDRLTDEQISEFMKSEFPGLDAITFDRVEIARGKYNRGGFHKKDKSGRVVRPKIHSTPHTFDDRASGADRSTAAPHPPIKGRIVTHGKDFKSHKK